MKNIAPAAMAAIEAGEAIVTGAVKIVCGPSRYGPIVIATVAAGGTGYAIGDSGLITGNSADAAYTVLTVGGGGEVLTFSVTPGTEYELATARATTVVTGTGDGAFTVDISEIGNAAVPGALATFSGLSWQLACGAHSGASACASGDDSSSVVLSGDPGTTYTAQFRIRGLIELVTYTGGTPISAYVVKDATGQSGVGINTYKLEISDPPATYYLNNGTFTLAGLTPVDYEITIQFKGDATLTLDAASNDGIEQRNHTNLSIADDDPAHPIVVAQPYDGQFLQMDLSIGEVRVWGGYGTIEIGGEIYQGIGARGLAQQNAGALGGVAQGLTLSLSGLEPAVLELLDSEELKGAPVVLYRLIFASDGKTLLDAHVFDRGRVDTVDSDETVGGEAAIMVAVESAARGLGRYGGRRRADSDQRLIDPADGYFKHTAYAGQKVLWWGGKRPSYGGAG